ncbi:ABC transporter ATP-binding protein [Tamlana sp. 2_MG-2023]|uniref:ABC transporter ATP-binding protein n=1 Tax=unclassified Tamlana TaxID=2614803 RepID=UPI0026E419BD|nr:MULTISPECIES: ABC transporter ATP-binding protein [unclassified Tamlana]MDO6761296.1 ABC transporter ATP-binding protein [Tamlana sp. 2_MG-2023]MDO6791779.1 ABC transporter ATP-binding protein [Tamlana sp. 1_MG-2023]
MIHCKDISFKYPKSDFIFQLADLNFESSQQTAVIGPSGCGKTTFIHLLSGILLPESGSISIDNVIINQYKNNERRDFRIATIGLIFQEFELLEYLSVLDNILLPYRINSILQLDETVKQRAKDLADRVGLSNKLNRYPKQLSQGERQRVAVCRALITQPKVLLCDEPTANLDPENRDNIINILTQYCKVQKTTLIVVTHDHDILNKFEQVVNLKSLIS